MSSTPLHLLILIFLAFKSMLLCATTRKITDMQTLLSFKSSISDPNGALLSWNHSLHFCKWPGVTCGKKHTERVTDLQLNSFGLSGQIPPLLGNLSFLHSLELSENQFNGQIPQEFGKLSRLQLLNLSVNNLEGKIPTNLTRCYNLHKIDVFQNYLSGEIPRGIGMLPNLSWINFSRNNLMGSLPSSLGNMSSLQYLQIYENGLEGSIPYSIGRLSTLIFLNLRDNKLTGSIPSSFYNLSGMRGVVLAMNLLEGSLPSNLFNALPNLRLFYVYRNRLQGLLPASLPNASNLVDLQMRLNSFHGIIPSELGNMKFLQQISLGQNHLQASKPSDWNFFTSLTNCTSLKILGLDSNMLQGPIPTSIGNLSSSIQQIGMCSNQIYGSIPNEIGDLNSLTNLYLCNNHLTGKFPKSIGRLHNLCLLDLGTNSLTGRLPDSVGNLTQLIALHIGQNNLNESIPESMGNCNSLQQLDMRENKFSGPIPKHLFNLSSLVKYLVLSSNLLSGSLPDEVGNLKNLGAIALSDNKLSGELPRTLVKCQSLEYLYLQGNHFQGTIPPSLDNLKGLLRLDLSHNNFTREIPTFLQKLGALQYLNLSFNDLEGEVPTDGIFKNITEVSIRGNSKLCGGNPGLHLHPCKSDLIKKQTHVLRRVLIPILSLALSSVIFLIILLVFYKFKKLRNRILHEPLFEDKYTRVSYIELLRATNGFSASNLIGMGSFGSVYKGIIDRNTVAIKVLNLKQHGASKSFMTECRVLRSIRHRNLVKIITSCSTIDYKGNEVKALVLKYMPNGSLENWLHQSEHETSSTNTLTILQRLSVAIHVAYALDYLHYDAAVPIIHCDLKPSNVLLDEEMQAHLGDFGLARLLHCKASETDENLTRSLAITGTIGYVAPEYGMGGQISTEGDIYSYGIILLELLTGKRPTHGMFEEGLSLRTYVQMTPTDRILDIVDPSVLLSEGRMECIFKVQECIAKILSIGLACSREDPKERMQIKDAIKELHAIQQMLLNT